MNLAPGQSLKVSSNIEASGLQRLVNAYVEVDYGNGRVVRSSRVSLSPGQTATLETFYTNRGPNVMIIPEAIVRVRDGNGRVLDQRTERL